MPHRLSRRMILALPLALGACAGGGARPVAYPPLDYSYLPPLRLNVAHIAIEQRFMASGQPPSVNQYDPVSPTAALRRMAEERLKPYGTAGKAVFVIDDASLVQNGQTITGTFAVRLEIYTSADTRAGFAEASVSQQRVGEVHDLAGTLYRLTRKLMDRMNVELEYQIRRSLGEWLVTPGAPPAPVQAAPLTPSGAAPAAPSPATGPAGSSAPVPQTPVPLAPVALVPVAPPVLPPAR